MPPKRARSTQQTLAFGPRSKITKPTPSIPTSRASKKSKKPSSLLSQQPPRAKVSSSTPSPTFPSEEDDDNTDTTETQHSRKESPGEEGETLLAIRQPPTPARRSEIETRAAKLGSVDLNRYWRGKEEERKARRVHQDTLSIPEKILRHFDISSQYGPCIGIPRTKRWKRAHGLGLNPPIEVLAVLLQEQEQERAYLDDLLQQSGRGGD